MEYIWCFERELGEMCLLTRFMWTKKKPVLAVIICTILVASVALWQMSQLTEAAILNPHPGLVGWWSFDEETGIVAKDSSGNGNDGTIYGATLGANGKYGKALSFNGINNYVDLPYYALSQLKTFTILAWVYPKNASNTPYIYAYNFNGEKFYLGTARQVTGTLWDGSNDHTAYGPTSVPLNAWNLCAHVVNYNATLSSTTHTIYVNGVPGTPNTFAGSVATGVGGASIGSVWKQYQFFNGSIDEVLIYDRALSAAEIQENYQKSPGFSSKLLAKVPKDTTQIITTLSWQGTGTINVTIQSPSTSYTEDTVPVYQRTSYSTSSGTFDVLNIKRLSVSIAALASDQNWYIILTISNVQDYKISVEVQK